MHTTITAHLMRDEKLAEIIPHIDLHSIDVHNDIYLDLLDSIVSQQLSVKVAGIIFQRFLQIFPDANPSPENILFEDNTAIVVVPVSSLVREPLYALMVSVYWILPLSFGVKTKHPLILPLQPQFLEAKSTLA